MSFIRALSGDIGAALKPVGTTVRVTGGSMSLIRGPVLKLV
jgi:hypothetical protein